MKSAFLPALGISLAGHLLLLLLFALIPPSPTAPAPASLTLLLTAETQHPELRPDASAPAPSPPQPENAERPAAAPSLREPLSPSSPPAEPPPTGASFAPPAPHPAPERYPLVPIKPEYPFQARRRGQEGRVVVEIGIRPDGSVETVAIKQSSGYPLLDTAVRRAVEKSRFNETEPENGLFLKEMSFLFQLKL